METTFTANAAPSSSEACNERDEQFPAGSHGYEEPALRPQTEKDGLLGRVSHWKWKQVFTVITLWLGYLSVGTAYSTIAPFFPNEATQHGSTPLLTGFIIGCAPLCVVILSPIFGYYIPQLGVRFTLLSGLWLVGGSYILLSFVASMPSGWVFILFSTLLRITEGVGSAMFITSVFRQIPELFPGSVGTITGIMTVGGGLGFAIGPALGGVLYSVGGFKLPFLTVGGFNLSIIVPTFFSMRGSNTDCKRQVLPFRTIVKLLTNFIYFLLVVASIFGWALWGFFSPTLEPFLSSQFHLNEQQIGLVFLTLPIVSTVCAPVIGKLVDKFGPRQFTIIGYIIAAVSFFLVGPADFISQPKLWLTIVATTIFGLASSLMLVPNFTDMLAVANSIEDSEATASVVSGITASALSFGEFIGPIIGGGLTQVMDFPTSATVFGEVLLAAPARYMSKLHGGGNNNLYNDHPLARVPIRLHCVLYHRSFLPQRGC